MWAMLTESLREAVLIGENGLVLFPGRNQIVVLWSEIESFEMVKEPSTWLAHYSLLIHKSEGGSVKVSVFVFPDVRTLQLEVENVLIRRDVDFFYPHIVDGETVLVGNVLVALEGLEFSKRKMPFSAVQLVRIKDGTIDFYDRDGWHVWAKPQGNRITLPGKRTRRAGRPGPRAGSRRPSQPSCASP